MSMKMLYCFIALILSVGISAGCVNTSEEGMSDLGGSQTGQGAIEAGSGDPSGGGGMMDAGSPTAAAGSTGEGGQEIDLNTLPEQITVATYNVQNLFDLIDDPNHNEYEYTPSSTWNMMAFEQRLNHLVRVIREINADILTLQEVESEVALEALADHLRMQNGPDYPYLAVSNTSDSRGIRLAVMSKFPFDRAIGRPINEDFACQNGTLLDGQRPEARPIYEISLWGSGNEALLTLLVNHWKSKSADPIPCEVSEHHQRAGKQIRDLIQEWLEERPDRSIIVLGDLNAKETEPALYEALGSVTNQNELRFMPDLYNLWGELGVGQGQADHASNSSYNYNGDWQRLDHIMLTQPMIENRGLWQLQNFELVRPTYVIQNGRPYRWDLEEQEGYSDHFPIKVTLRRRSDN